MRIHTALRCLRLGAGRPPRYRGRLALCAVSTGPCEVPSGAALPTSSTLLRRRVSRLLGAPLAEWRLHTVASSMASEAALESFYGMFGMLRVHLVQVYEAEIPNWARRQKYEIHDRILNYYNDSGDFVEGAPTPSPVGAQLPKTCYWRCDTVKARQSGARSSGSRRRSPML